MVLQGEYTGKWSAAAFAMAPGKIAEGFAFAILSGGREGPLRADVVRGPHIRALSQPPRPRRIGGRRRPASTPPDGGRRREGPPPPRGATTAARPTELERRGGRPVELELPIRSRRGSARSRRRGRKEDRRYGRRRRCRVLPPAAPPGATAGEASVGAELRPARRG